MTVEIPIISTYKDKGARQAQSSLDKLSGTAKKLGLALGLALSVNKIVAFGRTSVKEFTDAQKASAALQNTLNNTGNLLAFPDTEAGIKNLAKLSGVADDLLIPAFSQLYRSTGNIQSTMKDLDLAINVARGSGNDLGSVIDALSKGYAGNTRALGNLNLGLSKSYLAAGNMAEITAQLNKQFSGASAAYLDTYAGKMEVLNNQWNETKEIIGQGLVIAFEKATGDKGVGGMTDAMETFGYIIDAIVIKTGTLINSLTNNIPLVSSLIQRVIEGWSYLLGVDDARLMVQNEIWKTNTKMWEQAQKTADDQAKRNKEYLAFLAKQKKMTDAAAAARKKQLADEANLKKASSLFDLDKIQIIAALQGQITDNEKLRLQLQFALLQDNAAEAQRLGNELALSQLKTTDLALAISRLPKALNPFEGWSSEIDALLAKLIEMYRLLQQKPNEIMATSQIYGIGGSGGLVRQREYDGNNTNSLAVAAIATPQTMLPDWRSYRSGERGDTYIINGATQGLLDELRNGLINSSASGSFSTINSAAG